MKSTCLDGGELEAEVCPEAGEGGCGIGSSRPKNPRGGREDEDEDEGDNE